MPVETKNEDYEYMEQTWRMMRDSFIGERAVKSQQQAYLPCPPALMAAKSGSSVNQFSTDQTGYSRYLGFAEFPEILSPARVSFQGLIHAKNAKVTLPKEMQYLIESATSCGKNLEGLWRTITEQVLSVGSYGLMIDIAAGSPSQLNFVLYPAETLTNWFAEEKGFSMVVLSECEASVSPTDQFKLVVKESFLELRLGPNGQFSRRWTKKDKATIKNEREAGTFVSEYSAGPISEFTFRGKPSPDLLFYRITYEGLGHNIFIVPMKGLADRAHSAYRKSADYNRSLYNKSDPQPVIAGINPENAPSRVGGDTVWAFKDPQANAYYLDIDGQGIPLMRTAIQDDFIRFDKECGKITNDDKSIPDSGEAIRRKQVLHHVNLRSLVVNTGEAFEQLLRKIAVLMGLDPASVEFEPDLDFSQPEMSGESLLAYVTAMNNGAPLSSESLHELQVRGGLTSLSYEEENRLIKARGPLVVAQKIGSPPANNSGVQGTEAKV